MMVFGTGKGAQAVACAPRCLAETVEVGLALWLRNACRASREELLLNLQNVNNWR